MVVAVPALVACGAGSTARTAVGSPPATRAGALPASATVGGRTGPPGCPGLTEPRRLAPADRPTAALRCVASTEVVPGDGEYEVTLTERATQDLQPLVKALRLPNSPPPSGEVGCRAYGTQNWVVLELGGTAVAVQTPVDACSHPLPQVDRALEGLHWTRVSRTRGAKVRAAAAVEAQCESFKDLLTYVPAAELKPATARPSIGTGGGLKVCLYSVSYPNEWTADGRQGLDGVPIGGGTLTGDQADLVRSTLGKAPPADTCTQRHTRFAVVSPLSPDGASAGWLSVELDGCRRILTEDDHVSAATDDLVSLLAGLAPKS